jgi:hypothetical protein
MSALSFRRYPRLGEPGGFKFQVQKVQRDAA